MDSSQRGYIAPIVYRADRCEAKDVAALTQLMAALTQGAGGTGSPPLEHQLWGWVLSNNILHSEFGEIPRPSAMQLAQWREGLVASRNVTVGIEPTLNWPAYPLDRFAGQYATTRQPMLMLQGLLDPATIVRKARELKPAFSGPNQTWVELPYATHTTLVSSPFVNALGERRSCATGLMMAFIENPTSPIDLGCVARTEGINWNLPNVQLNQAFFATNDAWE
jgi:hypothetical protein